MSTTSHLRNVANECPCCGCYLPSIGHLQSEYLAMSKAIFNPMFGHNASVAQAELGRRLIAAGFPTIPNIFGDIIVKDTIYR
jgi:hypothetical protein